MKYFIFYTGNGKIEYNSFSDKIMYYNMPNYHTIYIYKYQ